MNTLVVICHPAPDSLTRTAAARVLAGLERAGRPVRVLDLDELAFDPRLSVDEKRAHLGSPDDRPHLADHVEALCWAERLVLVYPTWFSGQPARLKGWFDRVWMHGLAFELPEGASRIRGRLRDLRRIEVVTSHGSTRWVNWLQGNGGRLTVNRTLRVLCSRRCRTRWHVIYDIDNKPRAEIARWLDRLETCFSRTASREWRRRPDQLTPAG